MHNSTKKLNKNAKKKYSEPDESRMNFAATKWEKSD